ncbi:hypothetical protein QYM36_005897, partial [Artemia franciscana]
LICVTYSYIVKKVDKFEMTGYFRLQIEKIDGGFSIGGTSVAANCHIIIIVFAFCFILVGMVLTAISYRPIESDEKSLQYTASIIFGGYTHVVGPILLTVGVLMFFFGLTWCFIVTKVKRDEKDKEMQRLSWSCSPELYSTNDSPERKVRSLPGSGTRRSQKRHSLPALDGRIAKTKKKMRFAVFPTLDERNSDGSADSGGKVSLVKDSQVMILNASDEREDTSPTYSLQSLSYENEILQEPRKSAAFTRSDVANENAYDHLQEPADVASFPQSARFLFASLPAKSTISSPESEYKHRKE